MNHESVNSKLYEYFDGELDAVSTREVESHLSACDGCRAELENWSRVSAALFAEHNFAPTPDIAAKVMQRISRGPVPDPAPGFSWGEFWGLPRWELVTVSAVLALAVLYSIIVKAPVSASPSLETVLLSSANIENGSALLFAEKEPEREDVAGAVLGEGSDNE